MCVDVNPCKIPIHSYYQSAGKNNTTFCMFLMAIFQFLREKTKLTITIFIASFKHIITLIFRNRSVPALFSLQSAVHSGGVSLIITMSWQSTMENLWFWSWGSSTGNNPACAFACCSRERKKRKHKISLWIIEALWVSVKGKARAANK